MSVGSYSTKKYLAKSVHCPAVPEEIGCKQTYIPASKQTLCCYIIEIVHEKG